MLKFLLKTVFQTVLKCLSYTFKAKQLFCTHLDERAGDSHSQKHRCIFPVGGTIQGDEAARGCQPAIRFCSAVHWNLTSKMFFHTPWDLVLFPFFWEEILFQKLWAACWRRYSKIKRLECQSRNSVLTDLMELCRPFNAACFI